MEDSGGDNRCTWDGSHRISSSYRPVSFRDKGLLVPPYYLVLQGKQPPRDRDARGRRAGDPRDTADTFSGDRGLHTCPRPIAKKSVHGQR